MDHATTGDGILSALQLLQVMREKGAPLSELSRCLTKYPQTLVNVRVSSKPPIEGLPRFMRSLKEFEASMNGRGRVLVRYSGTEPLARIMVEGEEQTAIESAAHELARLLQEELGAEA
jgi:phosphoglucosamine mutase